MKILLVLLLLLFLHKSTSLPQTTFSEYSKSINEFHKLLINKTESTSSSLKSSERQYITSVNGVTVVHVLGYPPELIEITNQTHPTKDFLFTVTTPVALKPNKPFSIVVKLLEEPKHPVKFNLSIVHNQNLLLSSKQTTVSSNKSEVIKFNIKDIPEESIPIDNSGLQLIVLAESTGPETSHSIQKETISIKSRPVPRKEIIVETNKKNYFSGEKILYRITIIDFMSRRPGLSPEPLKIRFLDHNYESVWDEPVLTNTSALGVYTGSATARQDIIFLHVSLTNNETLEKYYRLFVNQIKNSEYFKINLESTDFVNFRESKLNLDISFLTAQAAEGDDELPLDGACEIQLTAQPDYNHPKWSGEPIIFATNITTSSEIKSTKMEVDVVERLEKAGLDYLDTEFSIKTTAKCSHFPSGLHVVEHKYTHVNFKGIFHGDIVSAKMFPDDSNNSANISIRLKMMRRRNNPLKEGDYSKPLNVTFDISKEFFPHFEFHVKKTFNFERIPSDGILIISFSISNFTAVRPYLSQSFVLVEIDGREFKLANYEIPWGQIPELRISHVDKHVSYHAGDTAKFYVCITETIPSELKLNTALFSSEGAIATNQSTLSLSEQNLELLEIKIPQEFQSIPTTVHLSAFAKCPFGFVDFNSPYKDIITDCVMEASISFDINVLKPTLSLLTISSKNNTNDINVAIDGGPGAIKYASVELHKLDETKQEHKSILTCDDLETDELEKYLIRNDEDVRMFTNAAKQSTISVPVFPSEPVSTFFFELKPSQIKNGSMEVSLSLDPKLYNGKYKIKAFTISDSYAGAIYTNEILINVPPPNISFHIPIVPKSMIVGETIELTTWVRNPSINIFNGTVIFEYFNNKLVGSNFTQSVVVLPNSYRSLKFPITAQETGHLVIKMRSSDGTETIKTVEVDAEGRLHKFTNSILLGDNNDSGYQTVLDNLPINYPPGCEPCSGSNITTQFYGNDIFGDLHSALRSGMLNKMKVRSYESTVNYWTIMTIAGAAQDNYTGPNHNSQEKPFKRQLLKKLTFKPLKNIEKEVLSVAIFEDQLFVANTFYKDVNASQLVTTLLGLQNEDGSFVVHYPYCKKSNSTTSNILDVTFVETIFGLLGLHVSRQFTSEQIGIIDEAMNLGLQFIESAPNIIHGESNNLDDTYVLSLLGYLYSTIKHKDADKILTRLKARVVSSSDGTFWNSKWNVDYSCSKSKRNFTITTTAFALMTYVNMEHPDTFEIARWLVAQRNANGMYKSLKDTAIAMRSLEMFKNRSLAPFALAQRSFQCSTLWKNSTNGIDFSVNKQIDESTGTLLLNICLINDTAQKLFIQLPPAYVFATSEVNEESHRKDSNITGHRYFGIKYSYKNGKLRFNIKRKNLLKKKCFHLKAYDLYKEANKFVSMKYKSPGHIEVQDSKNKKKHTIKYFFL